MKKNIGKNTLGDGGKMSVQLRKFARSTHDLSYAWRNTQGVGTLVPFMHVLGLPGDTFDIDLEAEVMTHPTVGPLFGSFKLQVDVFECPMRLYISELHNNALGIGMKMSNVKTPKLEFLRGENNSERAIIPTSFSNSNILSYLGVRNVGVWSPHEMGGKVRINGLKLLSYIDIFKNYYANKQEEKYFFCNPARIKTITNTEDKEVFLPVSIPTQSQSQPDKYTTITFNKSINANFVRLKITHITNEKPIFLDGYVADTAYWKANGFAVIEPNLTETRWVRIINQNVADKNPSVLTEVINESVELESGILTEFDDLRENLLKTKGWVNTEGGGSYIDKLFNCDKGAATFSSALTTDLGGLFVKTHQSDLFNNWVNTEWVDGDNGINAITAIDTSSGSFNLDTLNLAKKVYNMLNRIAVSGGTYNDWIETVYTNDYVQRSEIPVYIGGMSKRIEFGSVVSTSATETEPLATLAGRGYTDGKKGGRMKFKCSEPCYIIGIVSITPYVDYYQGNSFDWDLDNLDELHKPQLDGIGWQDITTDLMNANTITWENGVAKRKSIGKTIAWANYMTAVNENHGNFCGNESFMVLNRDYKTKKETNFTETIINSSTYIDPADYNYIFADTSRNAMNFWVQMGVGLTARRKMSAKQIPIM